MSFLKHISFLLLSILPLLSQAKIVVVEKEAKYSSQIDQLLTIKKIAVLPAVDNLDGIYARPIEAHIKKMITDNHHWDLSPSDSIGVIYTPMDFQDNPEKVKEVSQYLDADAFISSQAVKGPNGISLRIRMYLTSNAKLFSQSELLNTQKFDIKQLKAETSQLLEKVLRKIPYDGILLSRSDRRVTVNLGRKDGIENGKVLSVVQVVKAVFHPKFDFLISTEKEIIGKIKILKVDDTLSFGKVISEIEKNAIQKGAKVSGIDFVNYDSDNLTLSDNSNNPNINNRPDSKISFGQGAKPWVPKTPPTFGSVSAGMGIGPFSSDVRRSSTDYKTKDDLSKHLTFKGELWLSPKYSLHAQLRQGIVSENSSSSYDFLVGYNFRLSPSIWGPKVELLGGYSSYIVDVEDISSSITELHYSGLKLGLSGQMPITKRQDWGAGVHLFMIFNPNVSLSPSSTSAKKAKANHFSFFVHKQLGVNLKAVGSLDMELYTTKLSGATSNSSQKQTTLSGGLTYLF